MEFVLDSDDGLSSAMGTETLAAHDLVPEERGDISGTCNVVTRSILNYAPVAQNIYL